MAVIDFINSTDFQDYYEAQNNWNTSLSSDVTSGAQVIPLASISGLSTKGWVSIDTEHIYYDYIDSGSQSLGSVTYPVTRGTDGSVAASHDAGAGVEQRINAGAFNALMTAVKKRKEYTLYCTQVAADTISDQNITGFASRALIHDLRIIATDGSSSFKVEFFKTDAFKGKDRLFETIELSSVESALDATSSSGQQNVYVTSTAGFLIDELVHINNSGVGSEEFAMVEDVVAGDRLEVYDNLENTYNTDYNAVLVHREMNDFYYEDLDWTGELHVRITNYDASSPVTLTLFIIAESTDES
jgi:hypothetical protein